MGGLKGFGTLLQRTAKTMSYPVQRRPQVPLSGMTHRRANCFYVLIQVPCSSRIYLLKECFCSIFLDCRCFLSLCHGQTSMAPRTCSGYRHNLIFSSSDPVLSPVGHSSSRKRGASYCGTRHDNGMGHHRGSCGSEVQVRSE